MNNTSDSNDGSNPNLGVQSLAGSFVFLGVLIVCVIVTYASYMCKRTTHNHRLFAPGSSTGDSIDRDFSIVTIQHDGLKEATLSSYPKFIYSQLKPDSTTSACSICLADYDENDLLRLLPACSHLFHLKCVDPWLILHPTCPLCRNSPLSTPPAPAASVPT